MKKDESQDNSVKDFHASIKELTKAWGAYSKQWTESKEYQRLIEVSKYLNEKNQAVYLKAKLQDTSSPIFRISRQLKDIPKISFPVVDPKILARVKSVLDDYSKMQIFPTVHKRKSIDGVTLNFILNKEHLDLLIKGERIECLPENVFIAGVDFKSITINVRPYGQ